MNYKIVQMLENLNKKKTPTAVQVTNKMVHKHCQIDQSFDMYFETEVHTKIVHIESNNRDGTRVLTQIIRTLSSIFFLSIFVLKMCLGNYFEQLKMNEQIFHYILKLLHLLVTCNNY